MKRSSLLLIYLFFACLSFSQTPSLNFLLKSEFAVTFPATPQAIVPDAQGKPYFYLAAKAGGLQVYSIDNEAISVLIKTISIAQLANLEVMNATQRDHLLYLSLGNFFGQGNLQAPGLAILNVSNPSNPIVLDVWDSGVVVQGSGGVTVDGDYAYLCAMKQGMIILNISNPNSIQYVSEIEPDKNFPVPNPDEVHEPRARGVAIRDDLAFLCYDAGGLRVINIADKAHPVETGRYINPTPFVPAGKQQAFNNILLDGNKAYVAVDYCGMEILDISDTANITSLGWWNPWQCESIANLWLGSPGHTNHLAFDAAQQLVFLASGQSELSVVDVSNPALPVLAGGYGSLDNGIGTWGMTLDDDRVYLAYITAFIPFASNWAGVKILKWTANTSTAEPDVFFSKKVIPNPFSEDFRFEFELKTPAELQAELLDVQGQQVAEWPLKTFIEGKNTLSWQGHIPAGVYFLRCRSKESGSVQRLVKL
ncbi:MAG: T9SS type A sorting domain-containing protein [Saprospiraceae bacterium]